MEARVNLCEGGHFRNGKFHVCRQEIAKFIKVEDEDIHG